MKSIRIHLTVLLLLGLCGLCGLAGWSTYLVVHDAVLREFDYSLKTKVRDLATLTEREHSGYGLPENQMPAFERTEHPDYFQVMLESGTVEVSSPSLGNGRLALPNAVISDIPQVYDITLPGGSPGRAATIRVTQRNGEHSEGYREHSRREGRSVIMVLARDTVRLKQTLTKLTTGFFAGTLVLLLLVVIAIRFVVQTGLRPLDALARQAETMRPEALDIHFEVSSMPVELQPIAEQLNRLLERIDSAFQRERYLTAAMAHELYTPIAELRSLSEVALKWPDDPDSSTNFTTNAHAVALQMQALVDALLSLSRCKPGLQEIEPESIHLADLLDGLRKSVERQLADKKVDVSWDADADARIETDRVMLAAILRNILKNAAEYTPEDGTLSLQISQVPAGYDVVIENTNGSLVAGDVEHLFEPLWRKDKSRTGTSHSGLGLAVASRFCNVLGIQISATLPQSDRFRISLSIPRSPRK